MQKLVNNRTIVTRLVEREEPFNFRVMGEMVAKNIMESGHYDRTKEEI